MRVFLRCREFIIEPQPHTLAHYYLLDRARKGMLYICVVVYSRLFEWIVNIKLTLWSVCTLVDPEVKHIIYCGGWHSPAQIDKRISVHNKLFTLSIDRILSHSKQTCLFFQKLRFQIFYIRLTPQWPFTKFTYNQQNHLFLFKFVRLLFVFHPLPHNCHFSPLFFKLHDNLKSIRTVLWLASISRLSVLFVCLLSPGSLSHNTVFCSPIKFLS